MALRACTAAVRPRAPREDGCKSFRAAGEDHGTARAQPRLARCCTHLAVVLWRCASLPEPEGGCWLLGGPCASLHDAGTEAR